MIPRQLLRTPPSQFPPPLRTMSSIAKAEIKFGPYAVTDQVFYRTRLCCALVNIRPILPGHVLVIPLRGVRRLVELTPEEVAELFVGVQRVQRMLARRYFVGGRVEAGSFNVAIQDGVEAGQTVPHVHCHVIPRVAGGEGDGVYDRLQGEEGNVGGGLYDRLVEVERGAGRPGGRGRFPRVEDVERVARTDEEMRAEAEAFREAMRELD